MKRKLKIAFEWSFYKGLKRRLSELLDTNTCMLSNTLYYTAGIKTFVTNIWLPVTSLCISLAKKQSFLKNYFSVDVS